METKEYLKYIVEEIHTTKVEIKREGYFVTENCIGCGSCLSVCPQSCIITTGIPYVIEQEHCLHCGNCLNTCPAGAVVRR